MEEEYDELDAYIDSLIYAELYKLLAEDIWPYSCQFLKEDPVKGLVPFASGVFAELGGVCYILTASHVVEDWSDKNRLFVEISGGHMSIAGKACGTEIEKEEKIDVAYIKLKEEAAILLKSWYKFLPLDRMTYPEKVLDEANYCAFGFPVANPKNEKGRTIGVGYYVRPNPDKVFDYYWFDPFSHYVLEFRGKVTNIKIGATEKIKVDHYGLSGGGLWYTTIEHDGEKFISAAYLIGIMTEFRRSKFDCLIANRIENLLASLHYNEGLQLK